MSYEDTPYIEIKSGKRGNYAIQQQRSDGPCKWVHVDQIKAYIATDDEQQAALEQAQEALNREDEEFEVEKIIGHRGSKSDGTREVLIRWGPFRPEAYRFLDYDGQLQTRG